MPWGWRSMFNAWRSARSIRSGFWRTIIACPCKLIRRRIPDACFLPRRSHVTGDIGIHEIAWGTDDDADGNPGDESDELWIVNTRFSCLCTLDDRYSFVPRWRPWFVTQLAGEDRCHLNGLAMRDGDHCVTTFAVSDDPQGWRNAKSGGGCLVDVASGEIITQGLSMPHSPRWHRDSLWVLDSGLGNLSSVDAATGRVTHVASFPGYTRGLALHGQYAFVGLSKIRDTSTFNDIPIATDRDRLRCGVWVFDLDTGRDVAVLEFEGDVAEVFDVQLLPDRTNATVIGIQKETIQGIFSVPPQIRWEDVPTHQVRPPITTARRMNQGDQRKPGIRTTGVIQRRSLSAPQAIKPLKPLPRPPQILQAPSCDLSTWAPVFGWIRHAIPPRSGTSRTPAVWMAEVVRPRNSSCRRGHRRSRLAVEYLVSRAG